LAEANFEETFTKVLASLESSSFDEEHLVKIIAKISSGRNGKGLLKSI